MCVCSPLNDHNPNFNRSETLNFAVTPEQGEARWEGCASGFGERRAMTSGRTLHCSLTSVRQEGIEPSLVGSTQVVDTTLIFFRLFPIQWPNPVTGHEAWKKNPSNAYYDSGLVKRVTDNLRIMRQRGDAEGVSAILEVCLRSNFAGIESFRLYSETYFGTKDRIRDYIEEGGHGMPM